MAGAKRLRLPGLVAAIALAVASLLVPLAATAHPRGIVFKGWGTARIDGALQPAEWENSARAAITVNRPDGTTSAATVYVMNDATTLYAAFELTGQPAVPRHFLSVEFDNDHDGVFGEVGEDAVQFEPGTGYLLDYAHHACGANRCFSPDRTLGGTEDAAAAMTPGQAVTTYEFAHPLNSGDRWDITARARDRLGISVGIALCPSSFTCTFTSAGGDLVIAAALPTVSLDGVRVDAQWSRSELLGKLVLDGSTSDGASLRAQLAPATGGTPTIYDFQAQPGRFTQSFDLPKDLLPGEYELRLSGDSDGFRLPERVTTLTIPAPPEGVVREVTFRARSNGPPVTSLPAGSREIWVSFRFAVMPKKTDCKTKTVVAGITYVHGKKKVRRKKVKVCTAPVTISWYNPAGALLGPVHRTAKPLVEAAVRSATPLDAGHWRVELRAGGRIVKETTIMVG